MNTGSSLLGMVCNLTFLVANTECERSSYGMNYNQYGEGEMIQEKEKPWKLL